MISTFGLSTMARSVACKKANVYTSAQKFIKTAALSVIASVTFATSSFCTAHAEGSARNISDAKALAMLNSNHILTLLQAIDPLASRDGLDKLAKGKFSLPAPDMPIWVMEYNSGTILYYQGQPTYSGQPVAKLVDEKGVRFGTQAMERAKQSKSSWVRVTLGGKEFDMFCGQRYPFGVCTVVMQ